MSVAVEEFMRIFGSLAPSLGAVGAGVHNGYGRTYPDCGAGLHIEFASSECSSPYILPLIVERQQILAARAVAKLQEQGLRLVLANNNHSGLLRRGCSVWGSHENYLVEEHPSTFTELALPFLVTRIYAGSGGIEYPTANFLASVRALAMEQATGGGTTRERAIHSTAREEHHVGHSLKYFRYHQLLSDGHRSHYNLSLVAGATALALKAIQFDRQLPRLLAELQFPTASAEWVSLLRRLNVLATPGQSLRVDPLVIQVQRIFLEAARRYVNALDTPPPWVQRTLTDWEETLLALEKGDLHWLGRRLDAFAEYNLFSAVLADSGRSWEQLPQHPEMFQELALMQHSYHEFTNPKSLFNRLEEAGLLDHRVGPLVFPGKEPEPFVPETGTRAEPRARFIRENAHQPGLAVDWSFVHDPRNGRIMATDDPFATSFGPWQEATSALSRARRSQFHQDLERRLYHSARAAYDHGDYGAADGHLGRLELLVEQPPREVLRLRAWVQSRRGFMDGLDLLAGVHGAEPANLDAVCDYLCVYRFGSLAPDPLGEPTLARGLEMLRATPEAESDPSATFPFREHAAAALLRTGRVEEASQLIDVDSGRLSSNPPHIASRMLATAGDTYRMLGDRATARRLLNKASRQQEECELSGDRANYTLTALAKLETSRSKSLAWLSAAKQQLLTRNDRVGIVRVLVLEARLSGDPGISAANREAALRYQCCVPTLARCPLLASILAGWEAWVGGEMLGDNPDPFWNV